MSIFVMHPSAGNNPSKVEYRLFFIIIVIIIIYLVT